ncbi:MAG TPA: MFS transporter [Methanoregula sp.]|nr:MFS transporter [Methanoregula sp.]
MRTRLSLFFGIFAVMALSNAIVPVLPSYAGTSVIQGAIYSAYFLGAFLSTLPAGALSDRYGRVPVIRIGLVITVASGLLLSVLVSPIPVIVTRIIEGVGAGFFVAAAMSYVNSLPDHERMSGYLMASLNAGLVIGLIFAGWLAAQIPNPATGILVFSLLVIIPAAASFFINEAGALTQKGTLKTIFYLVQEFRWLWYSSVILIGITGVVISHYPKYSGYSPESVGYWISLMSIATIAGVLVASRLSLPPVPAIRWSALLMVIGVMVSYYSPLGFLMLGICAGFVMIAQMAFLAQVSDHQGVAMGLFSTSSYLGMTALPFITGIIADTSGFFYAFCATALFAVTVFLTIGKCDCQLHRSL